jgi:hypothetical protein
MGISHAFLVKHPQTPTDSAPVQNPKRSARFAELFTAPPVVEGYEFVTEVSATA